MLSYENLNAYQQAKSLYLHLRPTLVKTSIPLHLRDQLDRATTSILLNIAEGSAKYSPKDKRRYYLAARGSAQECLAIIHILEIRREVGEAQVKEYAEILEGISKMVSGLVNAMSKRIN